MLEDMGNSSIVRWIRFEADREYIVLVFAGNMQIVCAGLVMLEMQGRQLEFRDMLRTEESEAMELVPRLGILAKLSNSLSNSSLGHISQHFAVLTKKGEDAATIPQRRNRKQIRCQARPIYFIRTIVLA
jgi:hypothetical protein